MIKQLRRFGIGGLCLLIGLLCLLPLYALAEVDINSTTFPDDNFRAYVEEFDNDRNGKLSDEEIAAVTEIDVSRDETALDSVKIKSLEGLKVFTFLTILKCQHNLLTALPELPGELVEIYCFNNQLTELPKLPDGLKWLQCYYNQLTALPETLPSELELLYCGDNKLTSLPSLHDNIQFVECYDNELTSLPTLPNKLRVLNCNRNEISTLPELPTTLRQLICDDNQLSALPTLPKSLLLLECNGNQLTELPALPEKIVEIECADNQLTALPTLPGTITTLKCNNNQLVAVDLSHLTILFMGTDQTRTLWLAKNDAGSYSLAIELNEPSFSEPELSYANGNLTSTSAAVDSVDFTVKTGSKQLYTLKGTFTLNYGDTITASAGEHGSIAPSGTMKVAYGEDQTFAIKADTGYRVKDVLVNGESKGRLSSYTFENVQAAGSIAVQFELIPYTVTASRTLGGSITPLGKTTVLYGGSQSYVIAADEGYRIQDVKVNGKSIGAVTSYTFENVKADATIEVSFEKVDYTITATAGKGGSIAPTGAVGVLHGESQTFTLTAEDGYRVKDVKVNGRSLGVMSSYTLSNVTADATIEAQFEERPIDPVPPTGDRFPLEMLFVSLVGMVLLAVVLLRKAKKA